MGRIFLGDAGAYTFGHVLAWIALLLINRHSEISPLALLLIFLRLVTDMLLSMLRQKEPEQPIGHTYYFATGHCSDGVDHYVKMEPGAAFIAFWGLLPYLW